MGSGVGAEAGAHGRKVGGRPRAHTQDPCAARTSQARARGPWVGHDGGGARVKGVAKGWVRVKDALHVRQTHSAVQPSGRETGAHSMWRVSSSAQAGAASGVRPGRHARRGQHKGMTC